MLAPVKAALTALFALLLLGGALASPAAAQTGGGELHLIIALDTSASMRQSLNPTSSQDLSADWGNQVYTGGGARPASDPDAKRLAVAQLLLLWLADFATTHTDTYGNFTVRADVIAFDGDAQPLLDNVVLDNTDAQNAAIRGLELAPSANANYADWIRLYDEVGGRFRQSPATTKGLLVVTDSIPCALTSGGLPRDVDGRFVRATDCADNREGEWVAHLEVANDRLGPDVGQYVYYIGPDPAAAPLGLERLSAAFAANTDDIAYLSSVEDLGGPFFGRGAGLLAEMLTGQANAPLELIGVVPVTGGTWEAPPYQAEMDMVMILADGASVPRLSGGGNPDVSDSPRSNLAGGGAQQFQWRSIAGPAAGPWAAQPVPGAMWVSYRPAAARYRVEPARPTQYQPVQVVYTIFDPEAPDGRIDITTENQPELSVTVITPDADEIPLAVNLRAGELVTDPFYPPDAGEYEVLAVVDIPWAEPQPVAEGDEVAAPNIRDRLAATLIPATAPAFDVNPVALAARATVVEPEETIITGDPLTILRSQEVVVALAATADGADVPVPADISATLQRDGLGCAETAPVVLDRRGEVLVTAQPLQFQPGECNLRVVASFTAPNATTAPVEALNAFVTTITIEATQRLSGKLLDPASNAIAPGDRGEVVEGRAPVLDETILDRKDPPIFSTSFPFVSWEPNEVVLRFEFFNNENDEGRYPEFQLAEANTGVPLEIVVTDLQTGQPVAPDRYEVGRGGQEGTYTVRLAALPPSDYEVRVTPLGAADGFALIPEYEYVGDIENAGTPDQSAFIAYVRVNRNYRVWAQVGLVGGTLGLLVVAVLGAVGRAGAKRVAPLGGKLAIYRAGRNPGDPWDLMWASELPRGVNYTVIRASDFLEQPELIELNLGDMQVYTARQRAVAERGAAYARYELQGETVTMTLEPGLKVQLGNSRYYLVKFRTAADTLPEGR